ncbi:MAG: hypothetical protein KC636_21300 [Myxococcales bacterium]|nr:hypothetical protein [Myxococcales bacterium]
MNLKKVNEILQDAYEGFLGGCLGTDIFSRSSGMAVASVNGNPKACALFNFLAERINESTRKSQLGLPEDFEIFMIVFEGGLMIFMINLTDKYRWGVLVDTNRASLGIAVSVVIPEAVPKFREALV